MDACGGRSGLSGFVAVASLVESGQSSATVVPAENGIAVRDGAWLAETIDDHSRVCDQRVSPIGVAITCGPSPGMLKVMRSKSWRSRRASSRRSCRHPGCSHCRWCPRPPCGSRSPGRCQRAPGFIQRIGHRFKDVHVPDHDVSGGIGVVFWNWLMIFPFIFQVRVPLYWLTSTVTHVFPGTPRNSPGGAGKTPCMYLE